MTDSKLDTSTASAAQRRRPVRTVAASGRIYFWQSGSLWIGQGRGRSEWHEHHAHQLALALQGSFRFRADRNGTWAEYTATVVPSHCAHEFELEGATVAHLFVEPESSEGRALTTQFAAGGLAALPAAPARAAAALLRDALQCHADAEAMRATARAAIALLAGTAGPVAASDARLAPALAYIRSRVRGPVTLADAAAAVALSPGRFRHLFIQQTGSSFRAYLLWLRINVAIESAMRGASWTEAAHEAGFSDSSHLTRTHRRMFGIEPTAVRPD